MRHVLQKDQRPVINDGVDAGKLAEEADQNCHDQWFSEIGLQQVSTLFGNGMPDILDFLVRRLRTHHLRKEVFSLGLSSLLYQPARTFGNEQERNQKTN